MTAPRNHLLPLRKEARSFLRIIAEERTAYRPGRLPAALFFMPSGAVDIIIKPESKFVKNHIIIGRKNITKYCNLLKNAV